MKFKYKQIGIGLGFGGNLLDNILKSRGITSPKDFLNIGEHNIEDYHLYDNMNKAVLCYDSHIRNNSKMVILIDYDSDGYTSGAECYLYSKRLFTYLNKDIQLDYIIHSKKEHGLTNEVMLQIEKGGYNLVIIPDASSNDYNQLKLLKLNNIDTIVLDHHEADYYSEYGIIVNNQLSSKITNKAMTGVGVVYKFNKALDEFYKVTFADDYLDLVAFGMIADSCDLTNLESRYLVLKGLNLIQNGENKNKFISTIYKEKAYSMKNKVTIGNVAFYMCPFVNCIIRGGDYETKINLFKAFIGTKETFKDKIRGKGEVELCIEDYMVRVYKKLKKLQDTKALEGLELLSKQIEDYGLDKHEIIIVNAEELQGSDYNRLIVNKLMSKYQKHCILLKNVKGVLKGSGAGYKNKEISDLKQWCNDTGLFTLAQGHAMAHGVEIPYENINKLYELVSQIPSSDILFYNVDAILNDKTLSKSIIEVVSKYESIWGNGLTEPLFAIENIIVDSKDIFVIGAKKNTIKFTYKGIDFLKFNSNEEEYNIIKSNDQNKFTIIGRFSMNEYGGIKTPQVLIDDFYYEKCNEVNKFRF